MSGPEFCAYLPGKVGDSSHIQGSNVVMLRSALLIGAVLAFTGPALADSCGSAPIPPEIPGVNTLGGKTTDDAHTFVVAAIKPVKTYQGQLSTYRECLQTQAAAQKQLAADAKSKGDKAKQDSSTAEMNALQAAYDKTIDEETRVVTEWQTLHNAYCKMGDGLTGCPKK